VVQQSLPFASLRLCARTKSKYKQPTITKKELSIPKLVAHVQGLAMPLSPAKSLVMRTDKMNCMVDGTYLAHPSFSSLPSVKKS
jgi:hypothetical protein